MIIVTISMIPLLTLDLVTLIYPNLQAGWPNMNGKLIENKQVSGGFGKRLWARRHVTSGPENSTGDYDTWQVNIRIGMVCECLVVLEWNWLVVDWFIWVVRLNSSACIPLWPHNYLLLVVLVVVSTFLVFFQKKKEEKREHHSEYTDEFKNRWFQSLLASFILVSQADNESSSMAGSYKYLFGADPKAQAEKVLASSLINFGNKYPSVQSGPIFLAFPDDEKSPRLLLHFNSQDAGDGRGWISWVSDHLCLDQ